MDDIVNTDVDNPIRTIQQVGADSHISKLACGEKGADCLHVTLEPRSHVR